MKALLLVLLLTIPAVPDDVRAGLNLHGSISIEANVFYGDQDETCEPIDTIFYLLKENLVNALRIAKFEPVDENGKLLTEDEDFLTATAKSFTENDEDAAITSFLLINLFAKHGIATIRTNKTGFGSLKTVKTGSYYLFGMKRVKDEILVWHLPVQVNSGKNSIELDQHNTEIIFID